MKYRKDFVTNSSSSSFICDVCGRVESGYDLTLPEAEMMDCINGHTFCWSEMLETIEYNGCYGLPESACPICSFIEYKESDLMRYLKKEYKVPYEEVLKEMHKFNKRRTDIYDHEYIVYVCKKFNLIPAEIVSSWKERFGSYKDFHDWLIAE